MMRIFYNLQSIFKSNIIEVVNVSSQLLENEAQTLQDNEEPLRPSVFDTQLVEESEGLANA